MEAAVKELMAYKSSGDPWWSGTSGHAAAGPKASPVRHNIGSPTKDHDDDDEEDDVEDDYVDFSKHKVKDLYEEKYAVHENNKHTDKKAHKWLKTTRSYLVGRNPVLSVLLKWVEAQGERHILKKESGKLRDQLGIMTDLEPQVASEQLWSFLNLNTVDTPLREAFENVAQLNGFEAWRRITQPIRANTVAKRIALRKIAWSPPTAKNIHEYEQVLEHWETSYREYRECKGEKI